jgi:hypothetical protein
MVIHQQKSVTLCRLRVTLNGRGVRWRNLRTRPAAGMVGLQNRLSTVYCSNEQ